YLGVSATTRSCGRGLYGTHRGQNRQHAHRVRHAAHPADPPARSSSPDPGTRSQDMAIAPQRAGIGIRRHFTTEGVHPYDEVRWERRDSRITNYRDGSVAFEQLGVEVPASWSLNAT